MKKVILLAVMLLATACAKESSEPEKFGIGTVTGSKVCSATKCVELSTCAPNGAMKDVLTCAGGCLLVPAEVGTYASYCL